MLWKIRGIVPEISSCESDTRGAEWCFAQQVFRECITQGNFTQADDGCIIDTHFVRGVDRKRSASCLEIQIVRNHLRGVWYLLAVLVQQWQTGIGISVNTWNDPVSFPVFRVFGHTASQVELCC